MTPPDRRSTTRSIAVRVFVTCWMLYVLHFATNTVRELYPALSLGDHLSFDVSEYLGLHPDIFAVRGRGAFINNNPGAPILGAVPYAVVRPLIDRASTAVNRRRAAEERPAGGYDSIYPMAREFYRKARERGLDVKFGLAAAVVQALCMAPLSALSAVVVFALLAARLPNPMSAAWLALLYAVATPVFYRTAHLNQNMLVGHCALFAFALLWRPWDPAPRQPPRYLAAGLLSGWAVVCDYSGVIVVLVMGAYAAVRRRALPSSLVTASDLWRFAGGAMLGVAVLAWIQWSCFGNPMLPAQRYMPPGTYTHLGYYGMDWPRLDLLWNTAFDLRFGLFVSAPLLLLALYPGAWSARARLVGRSEAWCIAAFCAGFFLFCAANQYGRMQFNSGVRHVVPVSAFLFLIAAGVLIRLPSVLATSLAVISSVWGWSLAMHRDVERAGIPAAVAELLRDGISLPWLNTLQHMGYVNSGRVAAALVALYVIAVIAVWRVRRGASAPEP